MTDIRWICSLLVCGAAIAACGNNSSPEPEPAPQKVAGGSKTGAQAAPQSTETPIGAAPPAPAAPKGYSLADIKTIPDNCSSAKALLATAPEKVGDNYEWTVSRQALLANQQFRVTSGPPSVPGEIHLATYKYNGSAYALVATCKDGGTCNNVAAMYKAIVRSSRPQVVCGPINGLSSSPVGRGFSWSASPQGNLPNDVTGKCARLSACMIATDRSTPGDPFLECQKGPSRFKLDCAKRYPCSEVLACAGK